MFIIRTKSGRYKVQMRGVYLKTIRSEKRLLEALQNAIDWKAEHGANQRVVDRLQELLDDRDIFRISEQWGMINWKCRVDENGKEIR